MIGIVFLMFLIIYLTIRANAKSNADAAKRQEDLAIASMSPEAHDRYLRTKEWDRKERLRKFEESLPSGRKEEIKKEAWETLRRELTTQEEKKQSMQ